MAMTFWKAYQQAVLSALQALWWMARIAAVTVLIMWLWSRDWYAACAVAVIAALAGALAMQARDIQRWHQLRQK